jgi:hypothetical protein
VAATMNVMRLSGVVATGYLVGVLCAQAPSAARHPFLWDREFGQRPNFYIPEAGVLDSHNVLWVLCSARMGSEGYDKQHVTEAIFRIDEQGQQLSTAELGLPLSNEERDETSDYRLTSLLNGGMSLVFNKIRFEPRGQSYLGSYYTTLQTSGAAGPLRQVAGPNVQNSEFIRMTNGDLLLYGGQGILLAFDPAGAARWNKSFDEPILTNFASANLSDGIICTSAWTMTKTRLLNKLRVMQLDQHGNVLHTADIDALRGQVAGGPDGSCAVLYDRAPGVSKGDYYLTVFDHSLTRQWTVPVPQTSASGAEFHLVPLAAGYLAQINDVLVEYNWSGKEMWTEATGAVPTIVTPARNGFFIVTKDQVGKVGFHVKRAITTLE